MEEKMRKLMHNLELLVVTIGNSNWESARDAVSKSKLLLGLIEDEIEQEIANKGK
jgi:hypothetical protein